MTQIAPQIGATDHPPFDRRAFLLAALAGLALLAGGGFLLWQRFGGLIFFDMLAALQGCF